MQAMHEAVRSRVFRYDAERALIATAFYKEHEHMVPAIRRPLLLRTICEQMTVRVEDYEMIVGNNSRYYGGCGSEPDWHGAGWIPADIDGGEWTLEADGLYHNPPTEELRLTVSPEDVEAFRSIAAFWKGRTYNDIAMQWQPEIYQELCRVGVGTMTPGYPLMMMPGGHVTAGFKKIIDVGYGAIRKQARDWLDAHENDLMGENAEKVMFYTAVTYRLRRGHHPGPALRGGGGKRPERKADPDRKAGAAVHGGTLWTGSRKPLPHLPGGPAAGPAVPVSAAVFRYRRLRLLRPGGPVHLALSEKRAGGRDHHHGSAQEILDCFYMKINGMYGGGRGPIIRSRASATPTCTTPSAAWTRTQRRHQPGDLYGPGERMPLYLHDPTIPCGSTKTPRTACGSWPSRPRAGWGACPCSRTTR
jgi:formate C-acetyltransferase